MGYTCLGNCKPDTFVVLWNKCVKCALFSWVKVTHKLTVKKQDTHTYNTHTKPNYFRWFYQLLSQILQNSIFMLETKHVYMCETAFQWSSKDMSTCVRQHFSEAARTHVYMCETAFQWSCKDMFTCVRQHFSEAAKTCLHVWDSISVKLQGPTPDLFL